MYNNDSKNNKNNNDNNNNNNNGNRYRSGGVYGGPTKRGLCHSM